MSVPFVRLGLAAAVSLALAACGGGSDSTGTASSAGDPPPVTNPTPDAGFTLTLSADKVIVQQGSTATVTATVARNTGFTGDVNVVLEGLPAGVTASAVNIPAGATSTQVVLNAPGSAPHSLPTTVNAKGSSGTATVAKAFTVTVRGAPGVMDTSFGGGVNVTPVGTGEDYAHAVVTQADGKVIVAGSSATNSGTVVSLVRYNRDGGLDTSFGNGGKVLTTVGPQGNDVAAAIALQADGKIVVGGASDQGATSLDFALLRYDADGSLDTSFGNGGKVITPVKSNAGTDVVRALALQTVNGQPRILAVGGEGDFLAARYDTNGALDAGFGTGGKVRAVFGSNIGTANAVIALADGRAVLAGHINEHFAAVRVNADGSTDNSFGPMGNGRFEYGITNNWNEATALVQQADGKFILGGWAYTTAASNGDFAAVRIGADGILDVGFGNAGVVFTATAPSGKDDRSHALTLQADDRVPTVRAIQAGEANDSNHDFAVIRLWL